MRLGLQIHEKEVKFSCDFLTTKLQAKTNRHFSNVLMWHSVVLHCRREIFGVSSTGNCTAPLQWAMLHTDFTVGWHVSSHNLTLSKGEWKDWICCPTFAVKSYCEEFKLVLGHTESSSDEFIQVINANKIISNNIYHISTKKQPLRCLLQ